MRHVAAALLLCAVCGTAAADDADGEPLPAEPDFAERVNAAIDVGVKFLIARQEKDGSWGPCISSGISYNGTLTDDPSCHHSGPTSFAVFTLARCGVARKEAPIKKGLKWLRKYLKGGAVLNGYEAASIILALTAIYDTGEPIRLARNPKHKPAPSKFSRRDWELLRKRVDRLIGPDACRTRDGGWGYWSRTTKADISATQFALLALREAERAGYPVSRIAPLVWRDAVGYVCGLQAEDGSFPYNKDESCTAGMTAAALASLLICRERERLREEAASDQVNRAIKRAFTALGENYTPIGNYAAEPSRLPGYHLCYLYAVERVGALSRKHLLGGKDWYGLGAEYLLSTQKENGSWVDPTCMGPEDTLGTCFALLFLKRATPPVAITPSGD